MYIVKRIKNVEANRNVLSKINANISTLTCRIFVLECEDIGNSYLLIKREEKIPHIA